MKWGFVALLVAMVAAGQAKAVTIIDQQYLDQPTFGADIDSFTPGTLLQTFTPTLDALNFVELRLQDGHHPNGIGGSFYVNIRQGSITGSILGTSSTVNLPDGFGPQPVLGGTPVRFDFLAAVALIPETMYVIEPVKVSGDHFFIYGKGGGSTYERGYYAFPASTADLWFREGIDTATFSAVPEPSTLTLCGFGGLTLLGYAWRRRRLGA